MTDEEKLLNFKTLNALFHQPGVSASSLLYDEEDLAVRQTPLNTIKVVAPHLEYGL